ncbi:hypothetical protein [Erythrobacter sp. THAF29]|uniref:hypothetical protein n=1 Tax=Erythrobacter sp. THAF29 TaxID=2587851 RepID=UPI001267894E|nr:hypothetical protein [Erythrobacter sp. THAF29]QFT76417.1 hypothetical protein FIU90_02560 [Erythrobacter sp. THAF29]
MTTLSLALAPLLSLQAVGETPVAIKNDTPETWTIEYPRIITPFIDDYRRCLNVVDRRVTGEPNFENQHRADVTRCEPKSREAQDGANTVLGKRGNYEEYTPSDVAEVFAHIGRIHVARGADLDKQFVMRMQGAERAQDKYERERPKGLVIELHDASVVKARIDETNQENNTGTR